MNQSVLAKLQKIQTVCIKLIKPSLSLHDGFNELNIPTVTKLIEIELCKFFFKLINDMLPYKLA